MQIEAGLLDLASQIPSPNFDERPDQNISLIVIHCISLPEAHFGTRYIEDLFCNRIEGSEHPSFDSLPQLKVSSHLVIRRDGEVQQFVNFTKRAWHAGVSSFLGRAQCNDFSIGIELEGTDQSSYTNLQYRQLNLVCELLRSTWSIPAHHIQAHSEIAPGRKTDPGVGFDWSKLGAAERV